MMHITKIISGNHTGADQAAIDAAGKLEIDHCAAMNGRRRIGDGPLPETDDLTAMPGASGPSPAEKNVLDSDGTVIFSIGPLAGESALAADLAHRHGKPWLHIDLSRAHPLKASGEMLGWVAAEDLRILNIADCGPAADPGTYHQTYRAMWGLLALDSLDGDPVTDITAFKLKAPAQKTLIWPEDLEELVDFLVVCLPFGQRANISRMNEQQLAGIHGAIGGWIQETFGLWRGNDKLLKSAERWTFRQTTSPRDASWVVVRALATRLRQTQWLR